MKILIIDDDKNILNSLKRSLKSENFSVDTADNGEKGIYLANINNYDLIILDNNLPKGDGRFVCEQIRSSGKALPILVLSVKAEVESKVDLLNAGADDYMTKPFSFEELRTRIKTLLRRPKNLIDNVLKINDLILDTSNYSVLKNKKEIYLTRKEFALLKYLMQNKGKVLSKISIMEHIWDMNADSFSNTIETHILKIRRKIDKGKKNSIIKTIPGRGYRIG
jgi:DNA-binding response OmpR family regulator